MTTLSENGVTVGGVFEAKNSATFDSGVSVASGNVNIADGDLFVTNVRASGFGSFSSLSVNGDATVTGVSKLEGQVDFGTTNSTHVTTDGTLSLANGATTIDGTTGTVSVANGATTIDGATGRITTGGGLMVTGGATFDTAVVTGNAVIGTTSANTLTVNAKTTLNSDLTVHGQTTVNNFAVASGSTIDMGGNVVHDVGTPLVGTDAANKAYVDTGLNQLRQEDQRLKSGIAMAAAIPHTTVLPGEKIAFGVDWANYDGLNAFGADAAVRVGQLGPVNVQANAGISASSDGGSRVLGKAGLRFGF